MRPGVRADSEEELAKVEQHVRESHPDLVGKMTRYDLLAMAEDE